MRFKLSILFLSLMLAGCGLITGRGPSSDSRWITGLPFRIEDHLQKDAIVGTLSNQEGRQLQVLETRKFLTYQRGDGGGTIIFWQRFDIAISGQRSALFKFGSSIGGRSEAAIGKVFLGQNQKDFIVVILWKDFTKIFTVSADASGKEIKDYVDRLEDTDENNRYYSRRAVAMKSMPVPELQPNNPAPVESSIKKYLKAFGDRDLAKAVALSLLDDDFERVRTRAQFVFSALTANEEKPPSPPRSFWQSSEKGEEVVDPLETHPTKKGTQTTTFFKLFLISVDRPFQTLYNSIYINTNNY